jgi:hypothetical protein
MRNNVLLLWHSNVGCIKTELSVVDQKTRRGGRHDTCVKKSDFPISEYFWKCIDRSSAKVYKNIFIC